MTATIILAVVLIAGTFCVIFQKQVVDLLLRFCALGKLMDKLNSCFLSRQEKEAVRREEYLRNAPAEKLQEKPKPGYYGQTVDGIREGKGKLVTENGDFYDGEWKNGKKQGQGVYIYSNGVKYNGTWNNDKMDGYGSLIFPNGSSYYGEFRDGAISGNGTFKYTDKAEYSGGWKNGKWHGRGCFRLANGKEINAVFADQQVVALINDDEDPDSVPVSDSDLVSDSD